MPIPSNPPFLSNVLGYAADVNTIPATTPSGSGAFSYQSAFPAITAIPLTAGGVAPDREDFNAVFKLLSQHVHFLQSGSLYTWSSSLDYLKGAHILGSNGVEYIAQASSGPNVPDVGAKNPVSDSGTYWKAANSGSGGGVLIGGVMPFTGTFGGTGNRFPIPLGDDAPDMHWCLCDGITTNGLPVPDLRGRMIRGASDSVPAGSSGGSETHSHSISGTVGSSGSHSHTLSGSVGSTTLSVSQMPKHSHRYTTVTTPGSISAGGSGVGTYAIDTGNTGGSSSHSHSDSFSVSSGGSHSHSLSNASATDAKNLPLYHVLTYIMRIE